MGDSWEAQFSGCVREATGAARDDALAGQAEESRIGLERCARPLAPDVQLVSVGECQEPLSLQRRRVVAKIHGLLDHDRAGAQRSNTTDSLNRTVKDTWRVCGNEFDRHPERFVRRDGARRMIRRGREENQGRAAERDAESDRGADFFHMVFQ